MVETLLFESITIDGLRNSFIFQALSQYAVRQLRDFFEGNKLSDAKKRPPQIRRSYKFVI